MTCRSVYRSGTQATGVSSLLINSYMYDLSSGLLLLGRMLNCYVEAGTRSDDLMMNDDTRTREGDKVMLT